MRWYVQNKVNQEDSKQNEVGGMKKAADSTGKVMHIQKSGWWFVMRRIQSFGRLWWTGLRWWMEEIRLQGRLHYWRACTARLRVVQTCYSLNSLSTITSVVTRRCYEWLSVISSIAVACVPWKRSESRQAGTVQNTTWTTRTRIGEKQVFFFLWWTGPKSVHKGSSREMEGLKTNPPVSMEPVLTVVKIA